MRSGRGSGLALVRGLCAIGACLLLANCASSDKFARKVDPKYGVPSSPRVVDIGDRAPKGGGVYRVGKPYVVGGQTYVPEDNTGYQTKGLASWYGKDFHGRLTANGEVFDMESITAAHPTLPMPSYVRVTNLANRRSLIVRVNDRGPFHSNRVIDLSHKSAHLLGFRDNGVARVKVEYIGRAALEGSDDGKLMATFREGEPAPPPIQVASAKPFVSFAEPVRFAAGGAVPVPPGRPYSLGEPVSATSTDVTAVGRASRHRPAAPPRAAVSAFAPVRYDSQSAFLSGRGLY